MTCLRESITILMTKLWRIWAKALGDKSGKTDREADFVALIRTFIFIQLVVTNCFIVAGNIRHWNDHYQPPHYERSELNTERKPR